MMRIHKANKNSSAKLKRWVGPILALVWISLAAVPPVEDDADKWVVVLDAGHGGKDPGNLGTKRYKKTEKDVALDVTLMVGAYLEEKFPNVKVVYTRNNDSFLELHERVNIANTSPADLFVSIHCNSATPKAYGTETFVMGLHKTEASLKTAMNENAAMFLEDNYEEKYAGFDPKDPDTYIALSLRQNVYLDQSLILSKNVQDQFRKRVGRRDRGVKQAGYYVISFTTMPSALIELGFLTNKEEEDFLQSEDGKTYMASAIFRGIRDYKMQMEGGQASVEVINTPVDKPKEIIEDKPVIEEVVEEIKEEKKEDPIPTPKPPAETPVVVENQTPKEETTKPTDAASLIISSTANDKVEKETITGVTFKVQFLSASKHVEIKPSNFNGLKEVDEYISNGIYKYVALPTTDFEQAKKNQSKVRSLGYKDAFVVAFENGQRISMKEALQRMKP